MKGIREQGNLLLKCILNISSVKLDLELTVYNSGFMALRTLNLVGPKTERIRQKNVLKRRLSLGNCNQGTLVTVFLNCRSSSCLQRSTH